MKPMRAAEVSAAVANALRFYEETGDYRPVPWRAKALIHELTVSFFSGELPTEAVRLNMCACINAALRPWRL